VVQGLIGAVIRYNGQGGAFESAAHEGAGVGKMERTETPLRVGLIGHPVAHSRSPAMQQAALNALGILARYELWDTPPDELAARVAALREPGALGANVTIPHKLAVLPLLDRLAPEVEHIAGAVNTIVRVEEDEKTLLVGHNTDVAGLKATFREAGISPGGRRVVLLGAGGTALAIAGLVTQEGARRLTVAARRIEAAGELLSEVGALTGTLPAGICTLDLGDAGIAEALDECDLLINATSVGMGDPTACPIDPGLVGIMPRDAFVLDVVYTPPETALLRAARSAGLATANGLPMLLHQGAASFELWTGRAAPIAVMRTALGA
jgi:shikimate dehydrogenase